MSLFDRVRDTTTTTGTGSVTLANSAPTGFRTFGSVFSNNDRVYYCIAHQTLNEFEVGYGTYSTTGPALARTVVTASSNSGSAVSFSAGTKDVFCTPPATIFGDRLPEISITGATTATIDRMHVCSGTSADYTVTLPAAANNAGRRLWFRMASGLTRLVTLDGNASETIDGATTRVMWAGETCELLCDGSNWFKVAGRSIPMVCKMWRSGQQTGLANNTDTKILLNATSVDNTGLMASTGSNQINFVRTSTYLVTGVVQFATGVTSSGSIVLYSVGSVNVTSYNGSQQQVGAPVSPLVAAAGANLSLRGVNFSGGSVDVNGQDESRTNLVVTEVPTW